MSKLSKGQWQVKLLANDMDPFKAALMRALELHDDGFDNFDLLFHYTFSCLLEASEALGLGPPSPDTTAVQLREWLRLQRDVA